MDSFEPDFHDNDCETNSKHNKPDASKQPVNGMAMLSFYCGLSGILFLCGCIAFPAAILCGAAAIGLSILSKKGKPFSKYAIFGLIFGILALIFGILEYGYLILASVLVRDPQFAPVFDEIMQQYETLTKQTLN